MEPDRTELIRGAPERAPLPIVRAGACGARYLWRNWTIGSRIGDKRNMHYCILTRQGMSRLRSEYDNRTPRGRGAAFALTMEKGWVVS